MRMQPEARSEKPEFNQGCAGPSGAAVPAVRRRVSSWWIFAGLALIATGLRFATAFFPGDRIGAYWARIACTSFAVMLLIAGSRWLFHREGFERDPLGLKPTVAHIVSFLIGIGCAVILIAALAAALYLVVPFHWERGSRSIVSVLMEAQAYFWGNFTEELIFRGYALLALARVLGTRCAVWCTALPFGLYHFPGLEGMTLLKMIVTTGTMHFVFAYAFLGTRSLWAAITLHVAANVLLHTVTGLSGQPALFEPVLAATLPTTFDASFWLFFGIAVVSAIALARLAALRSGMRETSLTHH
jgi:uncharacterized protein